MRDCQRSWLGVWEFICVQTLALELIFHFEYCTPLARLTAPQRPQNLYPHLHFGSRHTKVTVLRLGKGPWYTVYADIGGSFNFSVI